MKVKIVTDSSADLRSLDGVDFAAVPLKIVTDDKEYVDDPDLDIEHMVEELRAYKGRSGTACPSTGEWIDAFGDADVIFGVTITSGLSGSYNAAQLAKHDYELAHPDRHVFIVDSLSTGPEMQLIIEKLTELIRMGKTYEEIRDGILDYQKHTHLFFALESLSNLAKNGRVGKATAAIAGALGIRVLGKASEFGTLEQIAKCRGELKTLEAILSNMKSLGYAGGKIRISHCFNERAALRLKAMMQSTFGYVDIGITPTSALCSFYAEQGGLLIGFETE